MKKNYEQPILSVISLVAEELMTNVWEEEGESVYSPTFSAIIEEW